MEVALELIPQNGHLGPMRIMHWAIRVGNSSSSVCYEFECQGVQIGPSTTCDHGFKAETRQLGVTKKSHEQIYEWVLRFGQSHCYNVGGTDLGGKNCQDFVYDLCNFLGVGSCQLPLRQARQVGGAVVAAGALAVGAALLSKAFAETNKDEVQWMWGDVGIVPGITHLNPMRWSPKKNIQATVADLEAHLGTSNEARPVRLFCHVGRLEKPTVAAAIAHLQELRETA